VDVIIEIIVQVVVQFLFEIVLEGVVNLLRNTGRSTIQAAQHRAKTKEHATWIVMAIIGFGVGLWWGALQRRNGLDHIPFSFWWTIVLAGVIAVIMFVPRLRKKLSEAAFRSRIAAYLVTRSRLVEFFAMNTAAATGIAIGWLV
jgi:uncharacterized membrane protein YsdA (DUF1294 family)